MNINWDEMPEWADVWIEDLCTPSHSGWHKDSGDRFIDCCRCSYRKSNMDKEQIVHYPPETRSEWNGEGLPPVGTVCEVNHTGEWYLTKIIGYDEFLPVFKVDWSDRYAYASGKDFRFRPIKSDKEKWVEQASKTFHTNCIVDYTGQPFLHGLDGIYDALISGELPIPKGSNNESK